jgi:hypothetical protein
MKYILFLMFFIAPPADPANRLWALQSTATMEFDSKEACDFAINDKIIPSVKTTDTVGVFAWCFSKASGNAKIQSEVEGRFKEGSSYYQWPPAPVRRR